MSFHSGFRKAWELVQQEKKMRSLISELRHTAEQMEKRCFTGIYYGRKPRNAATRQQLTKRLLKQAGISYSFNVLRDMQEAGVSYTRRNLVKDAFKKLGVF